MPTSIIGLDGMRPTAVVEPLIELGCALHVLDDPGHHDLEQWAVEAGARMTADLVTATRAWAGTTRAIRATPFVVSSTADFGAAVDGLPSDILGDQLLRPVTHAAVASREPLVGAVERRPAEAAADFVAFLRATWHQWFAAEWQRVRPLLAARARQFQDTVVRQGVVPALTALDPSVSAVAAGVSIAKLQNVRHDVSRRGLIVAPSVFIRAHVYVADVPGRPLLLIHPVEPGPVVPAVADLLRQLDVVANRGRLEVARAIATEPRTAGEIALLWRTDPTQVTRHLRALAAAGLARTSRHGRYIRYRLDLDAVARLGSDLVALLLR
jgi:DNA-binding transcriptional ArsR family regulator